MKRGAITLLSIGGSLILVWGASAITVESPYKSIVERNVFNLKEPPPAITPAELAAKAPPNIFLTGITTVFGNKRALLKATQPASKPGEKPVDETYMLTEGQREGDVEVVQIDEVKGMVKIRLAGKELDLDFDKNGVKISAAPVSAPPPGATPLPGFPLRPAGTSMTPQPSFTPTRLGQPTATPTRSVRTSGTNPGGMPYGGGVGGINLGGYNVTAGASQPSQQPNYTREEQAILIEVERERNRDKINSGIMAPPPITDITPGQESAASSTQAQTAQGGTVSPMPFPGVQVPAKR